MLRIIERILPLMPGERGCPYSGRRVNALSANETVKDVFCEFGRNYIGDND